MSPNRRSPWPSPARTRGVAILMAMITVSLVASLSASALFARFRAIEVETSERARVQASALLIGALDWARLILREDLRAGRTDHLAEPWAIGLAESRLSTFLAADRANTAALEGSDDVFLSGDIQDAQGRFNVLSLADAGKLNAQALRTWLKLHALLALPASEAQAVAENIRFASEADPSSPGARFAPLQLKRVDELLRMGMQPQSFERLAPFLSVLPVRVPINLNTAPAELIEAAFDQLDSAQARRIVAMREREPFRALSDIEPLIAGARAQLTDSSFSVSSKFFEVRGQLRTGQIVTQERALLQRESLNDIRIVWRERSSQQHNLKRDGAHDAEALLQSVK